MEGAVRGQALTLLLLLVSGICPAWAEPGLVGRWQFYKKVYQGIEMPEGPGATLRMHYEFSAAGESYLYWRHEGDTDYCGRKGRYFTEEGFLVEEVVWVDPENTYGCSRDPDMQLGRRTRTPYYFRDGDFALRFSLGDEGLDLLWRRLPGAVPR